MNARIQAYEEALRRFAAWFDKYRKPDGSLDAPNLSCPAYMPIPLYAHAIGDTDLLGKTLRLIEEKTAREETFLRPPGKGLLPYRSAWMLMGAVLGEHLSLATTLERWTLQFQHRETGGYFGIEPARVADEGEICFDSTANACAAFCYSGNLTEAERTGAFLRQIVQAQPDPDRRFFLVWDTKKGLVTQFEEKQQRVYVIEWAKRVQFLYKIGLLVRAFALLHARMGKPQYRELAESFQQKAVAKSPDVWTNTLGHKLGWSAYALFLVTKKAEYVEQACRVADHVASLQQPDGGFHYPEFWPPYEQVEIEQKINIGSQFATWIAQARTALKMAEGV